MAMDAARSNSVRGMLLVLPSMLWLLVFAIIPVVVLVCMSTWTSTMFGIEHTWDLKNYVTIASDTVYATILLRTARISVIATLLSLLFSYPLAMFLVSMKGRTRSLFLLLMFLPFWSSYVVRSFTWLPVLGRAGLINQILMSLGIVHEPVEWLVFNEGAVYVGLVYVYSSLLHANVKGDFDRLGHVVATPRFHHWHHGLEEEAVDKNFAIHFPLFDRVFGTFHLPPGRWPLDYGVPEPVPSGYWRQFLYPFRRRA